MVASTIEPTEITNTVESHKIRDWPPQTLATSRATTAQEKDTKRLTVKSEREPPR